MSTEEIVRATRYTVIDGDLYVNVEDVARLLDRLEEIRTQFRYGDPFSAIARALRRGPKNTDLGAPTVS